MNDLEHVDIQITTAEKLILLRNNFYKLSENKHFKEIILNDYCDALKPYRILAIEWPVCNF